MGWLQWTGLLAMYEMVQTINYYSLVTPMVQFMCKCVLKHTHIHSVIYVIFFSLSYGHCQHFLSHVVIVNSCSYHCNGAANIVRVYYRMRFNFRGV